MSREDDFKREYRTPHHDARISYQRSDGVWVTEPCLGYTTRPIPVDDRLDRMIRRVHALEDRIARLEDRG